MIFILITGILIQLFIIRNIFGIKNLINPLYIVVCFYLLTGIIGFITYYLFPDFAEYGYTSIIIILKPEEAISTLKYFLSFINTILLGALVLLTIVFLHKITIDKIKNNKISASSFFLSKSWNVSSKSVKNNIPKQTNLSKRPSLVKLNNSTLTFLCIIPTILMIIGAGPEKIVFRDYYLECSNRFIASIAYILVFPTWVMLGYNLANNISLFNRFFCILLLSIDFMVLFSLATRALSIFPIMITLGYWFNSKKSKLTGIIIATISVIIFSPLIYLPLFLRGQQKHGLLPYMQYVSEMNLDVILTSPLGFLSNLLFSFPLTWEVMRQGLLRDYPIDYLLISLNPLPGNKVGWYSIFDKLNLNSFTPFNTLGEMYLYGDVISFLLFFALGIMLMFITIVFKRNLEIGRIVYAFILLVLSLSFSFTSLQYNLRSSTRILYLAFVLSGFFYKKPKTLKE